FALYYIRVDFLQPLCYLTDFTVAYLTVVYFGYRGYMGGSAG
ncbi:unnamed protein product, partial [marine sediment metagenome]